MSSYKPHYACFKCRKTFKRKLKWDLGAEFRKDQTESPAKCPDCAGPVADMGMDFEAPKKKDINAWDHIAKLYSVGITFHSCGCTGPGYIPEDNEALLKHFLGIKENYLEQQRFWARRKEDPVTESEIAKDKHQNWGYLLAAPKESKIGTKKKPKYDPLKAQQYWNDKVKALEQKIESIRNT